MNTPTPEEAREALDKLVVYANNGWGSACPGEVDTLRRFIDAHSAPVQPEPVAVPWKSVVAAIIAVHDEARRRGSMFPQTSDERADDRAAVHRVNEMIEWYATNGGCVAERLDAWPKLASPPPAQPPQNPWRDAIDEALVVAHLGVATEPYDDLNRLLEWHHDVWLDPAVSSDAQALIDRGAAEERQRTAQPAQAEFHNPWRTSLENCISGDNYLRASEYCDLIEELDELYRLRAAQPAQAEPVPKWWTCDTHGAPPRHNAWGCPECVREMRQELAALRTLAQPTQAESVVIKVIMGAAETMAQRHHDCMEKLTQERANAFEAAEQALLTAIKNALRGRAAAQPKREPGNTKFPMNVFLRDEGELVAFVQKQLNDWTARDIERLTLGEQK